MGSDNTCLACSVLTAGDKMSAGGLELHGIVADATSQPFHSTHVRAEHMKAAGLQKEHWSCTGSTGVAQGAGDSTSLPAHQHVAADGHPLTVVLMRGISLPASGKAPISRKSKHSRAVQGGPGTHLGSGSTVSSISSKSIHVHSNDSGDGEVRHIEWSFPPV